jgi:hypothetical protein
VSVRQIIPVFYLKISDERYFCQAYLFFRAFQSEPDSYKEFTEQNKPCSWGELSKNRSSGIEEVIQKLSF